MPGRFRRRVPKRHASMRSEAEVRGRQRVRLQFMVDPKELSKRAYVKNPIKVRIIDPEAIFLTGILGESGRKLVENGLCFYFEEKLARKLIDKKIAVRVLGGEAER